MTVFRKNWQARREELRRQAGVRSRWEPDPQSVTRQLAREQEDEQRYLASLPVKTERPTSARQRRAQRAAAQATKKKGPKNGAKKR